MPTNLRYVDVREAELRCCLRGRDMVLYTRPRYVSILEAVLKYIMSVAQCAYGFHARKKMRINLNRE
jgi:hypothetical protein